MLYQLHSCPLNILRRIHNNTEIISLIYSSLHISKEFNLRLPLISSRLWQCYLINIAIYLKIRISNLVPARSIIKLIRNCSTIPEISRTIRSPGYLWFRFFRLFCRKYCTIVTTMFFHYNILNSHLRICFIATKVEYKLYIINIKPRHVRPIEDIIFISLQLQTLFKIINSVICTIDQFDCNVSMILT